MGAVVSYSQFLLNSKDVKTTFEEAFLQNLFAKHYDLDKSYVIEFLHQAQLTGANPILKQIHLTKYFSKKVGKLIGTVVYSYHFFLNQANQTGELEGLSVSTGMEEVFNPISGKITQMLVSTAKVKRKGRGETVFKARWSEFANVQNDLWQKMPYMMLEKTAIANVLRWAFPEALSGMFIEEEINDSNFETAVKIDDTEAIEVGLKKIEKTAEILERAENSNEIKEVYAAIEVLISKVNTKTIQDKVDLLKRIGVKEVKELHKKTLNELLTVKATLEGVISKQNEILLTSKGLRNQTEIVDVETSPIEQPIAVQGVSNGVLFSFFVKGKTSENRIKLKELGGKYNGSRQSWDFFNVTKDVFDTIAGIEGLEINN